jgi:hypothetical protein
MEGSYFFRSPKEEERKRREQLKKLPGHCPNCGEPIAALMLDSAGSLMLPKSVPFELREMRE